MGATGGPPHPGLGLVLWSALAAARTRFRVNQRLKATRAKGRMSSVDAWGYEAARTLGLKFLTGDPVFRRMEGVEFVR